MKITVFTLVLILSLSTCYSQDMIYFRDGSVKVVKIKNVGDSTISYKVYEMINSPLYVVPKTDLSSVFYKEGYRKYFNSKNGAENTNESPDTTSAARKSIKYDPSDSSTIYILYDDKMDESNDYPLYFNGKFICTLKNHSRLKYTMHSGGQLQIQRIAKKSYADGPTILLQVEPGKTYGINIFLMYPQALDPNKKFKYSVITDSSEINQFLKTRFYGFKPFKSDDFVIEEDKNSPLFK